MTLAGTLIKFEAGGDLDWLFRHQIRSFPSEAPLEEFRIKPFTVLGKQRFGAEESDLTGEGGVSNSPRRVSSDV